MPFLDDLIGIHDLTVNGGSAVPRRSVLNVVGNGVTATDNPVTGATDLVLPTSVGGATITPTTLSGSVNNYAPSGTTVNVTGLDVSGIANQYALRQMIVNIGSFTITIKNESSSSTAANRFIGPGNADYALLAGYTVEIVRDTVSARWRVVTQ
jgi:hypothetical protein